jgi:hypothetical protein
MKKSVLIQIPEEPSLILFRLIIIQSLFESTRAFCKGDRYPAIFSSKIVSRFQTIPNRLKANRFLHQSIETPGVEEHREFTFSLV